MMKKFYLPQNNESRIMENSFRWTMNPHLNVKGLQSIDYTAISDKRRRKEASQRWTISE